VAAAVLVHPVKLPVPLVASAVMAALLVTASVAQRMLTVVKPLAARQLAAKRLAVSVVTLKATPTVVPPQREPRPAELHQSAPALAETLVTVAWELVESEPVATPPARLLAPTH